MSNFLGLLATPIRISPDLGRNCLGDCRQGRASCPDQAHCAGRLTDADLAYEVTRFERDAAVLPIGGATAEVQSAVLRDRLKAWITPASGSSRINPHPSSIADVIALEHAASDEAHITGLELEHCQKYVRRNARLVVNLRRKCAELVMQDRGIQASSKG